MTLWNMRFDPKSQAKQKDVKVMIKYNDKYVCNKCCRLWVVFCNETSSNAIAKNVKVIFDIEILIINQDVYLKKGGDTFANSSYLMISETHVTISYIYWH